MGGERYDPEVTTRRGFLCGCRARTVAAFCTGEAGGLVAASGWRATGAFDAVALKELAEQTRKALAAMKPGDIEALRRRYGVG